MSEGIGKRVDEMFAFVMVHADGDEGVIAMKSIVNGGWLPLVGADIARIDSLRDYAREVAKRQGKPVRLLRFSVRETVETFVP